jgi:hypothetical protein
MTYTLALSPTPLAQCKSLRFFSVQSYVSVLSFVSVQLFHARWVVITANSRIPPPKRNSATGAAGGEGEAAVQRVVSRYAQHVGIAVTLFHGTSPGAAQFGHMVLRLAGKL